MSGQKNDKSDEHWYDLIVAYGEKFGEGPPVFQIDPDEAPALMEEAIRTGVRIKTPPVPKDTLF